MIGFKKIISTFIFVMLGCITSEAHASERPIIVIRLNQESLSYDDTLSRVMQEAREIKHDLKVVVKVYDGHEALDASTRSHLTHIKHLIHKAGIAREDILTDIQTQQKLAASEIHVYIE